MISQQAVIIIQPPVLSNNNSAVSYDNSAVNCDIPVLSNKNNSATKMIIQPPVTIIQ